MTQDLSHYTVGYYERQAAEFWFPRAGLLRPDQLAAVAYAFGLPFNGDEFYALNPQPYPVRQPRRVMSIGCGAGDLEVVLERLGCEVIGVDPSAGARELYQGKVLVDTITGIESCDTVICCESLEHLPGALVDEIRARLAPGTRWIIVNWPSYHPLRPDVTGWDHITRVDDDLFDALSARCAVRVRRGSHLVLDL